MAKRKPKQIDGLPGSTMIEVIKTQPGKEPLKKEMTIDQADELKKSKDCNYIRYQLGFSQFKTKQ